ncbi:BACON domain-containing protein [Kitasatospora paranensis]|uniref:Sigma-70 family RNA polymerase sigma factor n=1 Tax=Kitasatospora paranensis TaxID=258053 RepID=A0ABW2FU32_9ACTN
MLETPVTAASPLWQAYGRHVDGLFTYCLSVLCEHDAALAAVGEVRDLALRHGDRLADPELRRAWLYALARHCCLRRLEAGTGGATAETRPGVVARRREELARLAWPEAAGTDPDQREALELAVRHRLGPPEVAAVLGLTVPATEDLLAAAGAEVGRTRTALLVLGVGSCPELARLGGVGAESWRGWVLGPALRRELVQHVVRCPTCRGTAERVAGELEPGLSGLPGLPLLPAPAAVRAGAKVGRAPGGAAGAAFLAGAAAGRRAAARAGDVVRAGRGAGPFRSARAAGVPAASAKAGGAGSWAASWAGDETIRFDQRGFPRHRAVSAGRSAMRQRVVTTGVLAAVLSAPVVALWAAHRGGDGAHGAAAVSSVRVDAPASDPAGARGSGPDGTEAYPGTPGAAALQLAGAATAETLLPTVQGAAVPVPSHGAGRFDDSVLDPPAPAGPGQLTVEAGEYGSRTVITLTNSGGTTIQWHAVLDAPWLRLSRDEGSLAPGRRITVTVTVDETAAPAGHWTAHIALPPSEAVVTLEGGPVHRDGPTPTEPPGGDRQSPPPSDTGGTGGGTGGPSGTPGTPTAPADPTTPAPGGSPQRSGPPTAEGGPTGNPPASSTPPPSGSPAATGAPAP